MKVTQGLLFEEKGREFGHEPHSGFSISASTGQKFITGLMEFLANS